MAKITLELEEQDARIVAACISLAIHKISNPQELFYSLFNEETNDLVVAFLGLLAGHTKRSQTKEAVLNGRLDEITRDMAAKASQLRELSSMIFHQADPDVIPSPRSRRG